MILINKIKWLIHNWKKWSSPALKIYIGGGVTSQSYLLYYYGARQLCDGHNSSFEQIPLWWFLIVTRRVMGISSYRRIIVSSPKSDKLLVELLKLWKAMALLLSEDEWNSLISPGKLTFAWRTPCHASPHARYLGLARDRIARFATCTPRSVGPVELRIDFPYLNIWAKEREPNDW